MSEDKTQNGYEESQELDFQDAKEMTVGEAVRKEAEINAGVTETFWEWNFYDWYDKNIYEKIMAW